MDTKLLSFLTVIETKSYTLAAKKLNLTQPAISQHIKQLEEEYQIKLFNRSGNELMLTSAGEILQKYAKRIQALYNDLDRKINDNRNGNTNLIIGITHTSESGIAPEIFADYTIGKKGTHIKIISDSIKNLYDKLGNFEIDMAIIEGKVGGNKFSSVLLDTDSLVAIISNANPLSKKKIISINDLKKEKLILRDADSGTTSLFRLGLNKLDLDLDDFNVILQINSVATIKDLVRKDLGISILPRSVVLEEIKNKSLISLPLENMNLVRETSLVYINGNVEREILEDIASIYRNKVSSI